MKKTLILLALICILGLAHAQEKSYVLDIHYKQGELGLNRVYVDNLYPQPSLEPNTKTFKAVILSFDNKILYTHYFYIYKYVSGAPPIEKNKESIAELTDFNFSLIIPFYKTGKLIEIFNPKKEKLLEVNVAFFSDVCGDNICQPHESYESCPKDCKSGEKDDYCDKIEDGKCDPDCTLKQDPDCKLPETIVMENRGKINPPEPPGTPSKKPQPPPAADLTIIVGAIIAVLALTIGYIVFRFKK